MTDIIPLKLLKLYNQNFPYAWRQINSMREDRGKGLPFWPDWCFCPIAGSIAVITNGASHIGSSEMANLGTYPPALMAALAAWRVTKGIYRFDDTLMAEITSMPLDGNLPVEIFYQLPEWGCYIETPNMEYLNQKVAGFFVSLEFDTNDFRSELRLTFISPDLQCMPVAVHLGKWTISEALEKFFKESNRVLRSQGFPILADEAYMIKETVSLIIPFINLVLYICSINADFGEGGRPQHPQKLPKRKGKIPTAQEIKKWDIGIRLGPALKKAKVHLSRDESQIKEEEMTRNSPRPHIRRAHWHHYWIGSQTTPEERKLILKWLPPIPIGIREADEMPVVIHKVEKE